MRSYVRDFSRPLSSARGAATIIVEGGKIVSIADGHQPAEAGATLIDLSDKYVLPGLIDSHVHLTSDAGGLAGQLEEMTLSPAAQAFNAEVNGMKTLRAGFTTVRNLGDGDGATLENGDALQRLPGTDLFEWRGQPGQLARPYALLKQLSDPLEYLLLFYFYLKLFF